MTPRIDIDCETIENDIHAIYDPPGGSKNEFGPQVLARHGPPVCELCGTAFGMCVHTGGPFPQEA